MTPTPADSARLLRRALPASFLVYLIPLVGPHAAWLLGPRLWFGQVGAGAGRAGSWRAAELAAALGLQLGALLIWLWFFRRPGLWRGVLLCFAVPLFVMAANWLYLFILPAHFLIELDPTPEAGEWSEDCRVDSAGLVEVRHPPQVDSAGTVAAWLQFPDGGYGVLRSGDCRPLRPGLPHPTLSPGGRVDFSLGLEYATRAGALFQRMEPASGRTRWWYLAAPESSLVQLEPPATDSLPYGAPLLASDGRSAAWMMVIPGSGPPVLNRIHLRSIPPGAPELVIDLSRYGPAQYLLRGLDAGRRELTLARNEAPMILGLDGTVRAAPVLPDSLATQSHTWILVPGGWVAWDAYREEDSYRIVWSLPAGSGGYRVPRSRSITSVAVNPAGSLIALSTTSGLSIGATPDAVIVLRASDGQQVFRRNPPKYNRSTVAFLGADRFAWFNRDHVEVLRVPAGVAASAGVAPGLR